MGVWVSLAFSGAQNWVVPPVCDGDGAALTRYVACWQYKRHCDYENLARMQSKALTDLVEALSKQLGTAQVPDAA